MLFKFGDQEWIDSPYSAHLSKNLTKLELADEGKGLALHVYLFYILHLCHLKIYL